MTDTAFYADAAATAAELLADLGQPVTLRNVAIGVYDPATGGVTASAPTDATRNGALVDFGEGQTLGPGGLVQAGDKLLLLEAGVVPALEDQVIVSVVQYAIKGIGEVSPAGIPVLYQIHLRR